MRRIAILVLAAACAFGVPISAAAISGGGPDAGAHPYVGLAVFYDASGARLGRCSGTLLTSTVFLTAGHCTDGAASARVWFDDTVASLTSGGTAGTPYTHPDFDAPDFASPDVGVIVLAKPVKSPTYGALPPAGIVDDLMHGQGSSSETHTVVGYGLQSTKPRRSELLTRYRGTVVLKNASNPNGTSSDFVQISSNSTSNWSGGTCSGDSGGPLFLRDTNVVLAVTSFGTSVNCSGNSVSYRVDVASARSFLSAFVPLP